MIIGNRTLTTRYILPFIFDDSNLFSDKYDFINAYVEDINRPYLDKHIIVLFKYNPKLYDFISKSMRSNPWYTTENDIFIDNEYYLEYVFIEPPENRSIIEVIKSGSFNSLPEENKIQIISFWKNIDLSYLKDLLHKPNDLTGIRSLKDRNEIVTEEDYTDSESPYMLISRITQ